MDHDNIEEIDIEIENEFYRFRRSTYINGRSSLLKCWDNLYEFFKNNQSSPMNADEFLGEEFLHRNYGKKYSSLDLISKKKVQKTAGEYCNRINHKCYEPYENKTNPKVVFWIKQTRKYDGHYKENISAFRLRVRYKGKDYINLSKSRKREVHINDDNLLSDYLKEYLAQVAREHRYLDLKYLSMTQFADSAIELDKTYINLTAKDDIPLSESSAPTEHMKWIYGVHKYFTNKKEIIESDSSRPLTVEQILQNALGEKDLNKRNMVFLGAPGSGKTTILKHLALSIASGESEKWGLGGFTPIFVNLSDYANSGKSGLPRYIQRTATDNIANIDIKVGIRNAIKLTIENCCGKNLENGRVVFLLDALDETGDKRDLIVTEISRMSLLIKNENSIPAKMRIEQR